MKIQINAICKMHDQIWTPQIKRGVHTRKVNINIWHSLKKKTQQQQKPKAPARIML